MFILINIIVKLRQWSGKDGQGMALKAKVLKLKPLPRAYIKVGYHLVHHIGHLRVTIGHHRVTIGYFFLKANIRQT